VGLHVPVQVALLSSGKVAAWLCAQVRLLACVGAHVDCEMVHPGKAGCAALLSAPVGLLTSMEALVLLEVAAFTGNKLTPRVTASAGWSGAGVDAAVHCQVGFALAGKATARLRAPERPLAGI